MNHPCPRSKETHLLSAPSTLTSGHLYLSVWKAGSFKEYRTQTTASRTDLDPRPDGTLCVSCVRAPSLKADFSS